MKAMMATTTNTAIGFWISAIKEQATSGLINVPRKTVLDFVAENWLGWVHETVTIKLISRKLSIPCWKDVPRICKHK